MPTIAEQRINKKILLIRTAYIAEYRALVSINDQPADVIITALEARIHARTNGKISEEAINKASDDEFDLLQLLQFDTQKAPEKNKASFFASGIKKTLKILSDNDTSGYAARHTAPSRITADAHTTTHPNVAIEGVVADYTAIGLNSVNTLSVPLLYLYYYVRNEPIPFTVKNNSKIILSLLALALGVIAITVPPAGIVIAAVTTGAGLIGSLYALGRFIYERRAVKNNKDKVERSIADYIKDISTTTSRINDLRKDILKELENPKPNIKCIENKTKILQKKCCKLIECKLDLKAKIKERHALKLDEGKEKTIFGAMSAGMKTLLASTAIAGLILSLIPFTAPIGVAMLITASSTGIGLYVMNKIHHARMTRKEKAAVKSDPDLSLTKNVGDTPSSTLASAAELKANLNGNVREKTEVEHSIKQTVGDIATKAVQQETELSQHHDDRHQLKP